MYQYQSTFRFIVIFVIVSIIVLFVSLSSKVDQIPILYRTSWTITQDSTNSPKLVFLSKKGYWNFSLNSFINIHLEADITPNIKYFIKNNKEYLSNDQEDIWRSMTSVGIKIRSSVNETLLLMVSELWYATNSCKLECNSKVSYLYIEALTSNYRKISYNWSTIVSIPSILPIVQSNISECCSKLLYPRMINTRNNEMIFAFNKQRKIELYNPFTRHRRSLSLKNNWPSNIKRTLTPFVKKNQLHFVYSYKSLNILRCSKNSIKCEMLSKIQVNDNFDILQDGTQLVQFRDTDYFVGIASIAVSCNKCTKFYRPHLLVLSTLSGKFRLIYVSEPLKLDNIPMFAPISTLREFNSSYLCYGIIREMIPGFIIDWKWPSDKLSFTLSINYKKTFVVSIDGIGKIVQSLKYAVKNKYSRVLYNTNTGIQMISYSETSGLEYCEYLSNINKLKYQRILVETQNLKAKIIKDIVDSPTYPTFRIVSNANRESMKEWIADDYVNYGLIGRYLTDYNSAQVNNLMIDAGGNHGMYSLYGAMLNQSVHVFEVLPKYWIVIEESLRINVNIEKMIVLHKCGISDQYNVWNVLPDDGTTRLIYQEMNTTNKTGSQNLTVIEVYRLDDFIFQRISVMKIDVEGFEIRALKGAFRAIQFFGVGAILIEITPFRWSWNNVRTEEGISVLEYVTSIGHYLSYIIARNDALCPVSKISNITGMIEIKNLTMMNMTDGHLEIAPQIYQFIGWTTIIIHMKHNDWGCNFWLESSR